MNCRAASARLNLESLSSGLTCDDPAGLFRNDPVGQTQLSSRRVRPKGCLPAEWVTGVMGGMISNRPASILVFTILLACQSAAQEPVAPTTQSTESPTQGIGIAFFENQVRPILAEHCYRCHGPESGEGKGKLRDRLLGIAPEGRRFGSGDRSWGTQAEFADPRRPSRGRGVDAAETEACAGEKSTPLLPGSRWGRLGQLPRRAPRRVRRRGTFPNGTSRRGDSGRSRSLGLRLFRWSSIDHGPDRPSTISSWHGSRRPVCVRLPLPTSGLSSGASRSTCWVSRHPRAEIDAFLSDNSAQAFEHAVDRLLASPRYGERWGRHWLDVVRYADSQRHGRQPRLLRRLALSRLRDRLVQRRQAVQPVPRRTDSRATCSRIRNHPVVTS